MSDLPLQSALAGKTSKDGTSTLSKQRTLDPLLLIGSIIVLAAILTWVFPAGQFERTTDPQTHRTIVVPGSYKSVARQPVGPWGVLVSIPEGLSEAAEVVFFVLLAGGALTVVEGTGAFGSLLNHLMGRFGRHEELTNLAVYLLSEQADYVNGECVVIDGGLWLRGAGEFNDFLDLPDAAWEMLESARKK